MAEIEFNVRNDSEREKNMNSWKGFRHTYGVKVRGQRTRTTGRKGGAVGVRKGGKILPAGVPAEGVAPAAAAGQAAAPAAAAGQAAPAAAAGPTAPPKGGGGTPKKTKTPCTKPFTEKK